MKDFFIRSSIDNIFNLFKNKQCHAEMIQGFQELYSSKTLHTAHFDGTIDWYLDPLYHCEAYLYDIPNTKDIFTVDLGCGPSSVCYWMRENDYKWSYMGVDMIDAAKKYAAPLSDASFLTKKIEDLDASDLPQQPDVIFAVNSLCYVPDFQKTLKNLFDLSKPSTKLIIIDGSPSRLWNNRSVAAIRDAKYIHNTLTHTGWIPKKSFVLSIYNFANIPIMNISHSFLCERS